MKKLSTILSGVSLAGMVAVAGMAQAADKVKIAFIDPLSGPFATTGTNGLAQYKFAAQNLVNDKGGVLGGKELEVVGFDNKISPKESLIQLQVAIDQGIRFIAQGNSSGVANALTDAIKKHNKRNPDKRVLFLNYSAVDPALTNKKCNFWHFRFDANADIKMDALTDVIAKKANIKKIYLIGQDYSFGKAVAAAAVKYLKEKRPDIEIVGNELHPIGKVKDFTPYARKIKASGADAMITGNWGSDMIGLGKAVIGADFSGPIYTYYAASDGITKTFGADGKGIIHLVAEGPANPNINERTQAYFDAFKKQYPNNDLSQPRIANVIEMLAKAIDEAGSTDAVKVAYALEGMTHDSIWGGQVHIREKDHQGIQDVKVLVHTDEGIKLDMDNSGFGLSEAGLVKNAAMDSPTTCKMKRPKA